MESTEPGSLDDSKNLEPTSVVVEDMVAKYEDSEAAENEEDQSGGEQVYGYLYRSAGSEDATIYVDSRGFNLNGQSLIVTQNDDGNEIIVLVGEDPDGQPLDQTFAHSVLQSDEVSFGDGLKEHGTLVVDEHSQGLEFIKSSEEASEEHEERHMYIENSGEILNISNENVGSPVDIESPLWSVSNSGHLKNDGTEMLFIPNPTVVLAPEETKHRKLMQLACIAHELQSADQKSSSTVMCDYVKDPEASGAEYEGPDDKVEQSDEEKNSADEEDKSLSSSERERCMNFGSKPVSTVLSGSSSRVVDNTVSVIHSTSSEIQGSSLENQTKLGSPPDFSSEKNSESELPPEMLYSNISNVTFHDNLDASPGAKQLEECSRESLEENSQSLIPEVTDERCSEQNLNLELNNNDSPLTFIDKTHNLDVEHLNTEDNVLEDAGPDMKIDEDSHANETVLVIEDENPKSHDSDSNLSLMKCHLSKAIDMSERTSQEDNVLDDTVSDIDDDNISSTEHSVSVSENESSFLSGQYNVFNYKKKIVRQALEKTPVLSPALRDDKSQVDSDPVDLKESNIKSLQMDEAKLDKNTRQNTFDFEESPSENLDSDLVIAEAVEERNPCEAEPAEDDYVFREEEPADVRRIHTKELVSTNRASVRPIPDHKTLDAVHRKQSNDEVRFDKTVPVCSNSSPESNAEDSVGPSSVKKAVKKTRIRSPREEDYSSSEETPLMKTKKTYLSFKKMKKSMLENKVNTQEEKIVLYSDDVNDCDNNKEATSRTHESRESSPSTHANAEELDESTLVSTVSVTRTYVNSVPKEKSLFRKKKLVKQSLRSHSLRARSLPSTLPLNNGNSEVSDSDSKKNSFDLNNSDNIPWGKMLLETSFDQCSLPNDAPSTSFASQYPKETSTPLLSPEQQRRKLNKAKRDFDRLLNSSPPIATKQPKIGKKFSSRMHPNVIKATKSRYSNSHFSRLPKSNSLPLSSSNSSPSKSSCGKKVQTKGQKPKEAKIQYLYQGSLDSQLQPEQSYSSKNELYSCSSCNFSSIYVDNLMEHLKYCTSRQPIFDYEVNNMDKRQRIRGEEDIKDTVQNTLKKIKSDLRSSFVDDDPSVSQLGEDERDSDHVRKRKSLYRQYGYGDDDVVWVKFKDRFWPALVCSIQGLTAYVKLISYPKEVKGLKVKHENIRTFDNSKWNVLCLHEAQSLPYNDIFVKAVQSSERFMSKKFLGIRVTGKEFFSVRDEVDFATDSASTDSIVNEDSDSEIEVVTEPARRARYEKLDLAKILDHLTKGKADDHVLDIFNKRKHSQKHVLFFDKQRSAALKPKPWFGPFEEKKQKNELFSHFQNLFTNRIGKRTYFVPYICQVMIPEAIVQAISVVNDIPLKDAELLLESEDSMDLENEDPSVEDILKKYS